MRAEETTAEGTVMGRILCQVCGRRPATYKPTKLARAARHPVVVDSGHDICRACERARRHAADVRKLSACDCLRTSGAGQKCDKCGQKPSILHVPLRTAGVFCGACCPCCAAERVPATGPGSERTPLKSTELDLDSVAKSTRLMSCGASHGLGRRAHARVLVNR